MKTRIKSSNCLNCGKGLQPLDNFCPDCGQENDNKRQTFGKVMSHLVLDFLHLDSRVLKSLPALLFKPGFLSKEYLAGRRQKYLDPVKMFITIIVIYFLLSSFGKHEETNVINRTDSTEAKTDSMKLFQEGPFKIKYTEEQPVTLVDSSGNLNTNVSIEDSHFDSLRTLVNNGVTDSHALLDSLNVENTLWNRFYYVQAAKFLRSDFDDFKVFMRSKLPWVIFILVPIFALLLKLLYIRKNLLYIDHLIFAFHLHSFIFIVGIFYKLVLMITGWDLGLLLFAITLLYILLAFLKFYQQSWGKTFLKLSALLIMYSFTALLTFLFSMLVVFLIY